MDLLKSDNEKKAREGIRIKELVAQAVEEMICTNNKTLKNLLNEALDHKVIMERTDE